MENGIKRASQGRLAGEIAFLLLSLPMGVVFFSLTLTCFLLGIGTVVIWIGLPILFATLYMVHGMATIERNMVRQLLRMPHSDQPYTRAPVRGFLRRFGNLLRDPYTWTGMIYMLFIKLPSGIINFTLTVTFMCLSICLTCLPLVYLINVFIDLILLKSGVTANQSILIPYFVEIHGSFDALMFIRSFAGVPLGLVFCFLTYLMIRGLAGFSAMLANAMLGPGATIDHTQPHTQNYVSPERSTEQRVHFEQPRTMDYTTSMYMEQQAHNG